MANYIVGAAVAAAIFFALRHIYHNFASGRCDCLESECHGCCGENGSCAGCQTKQ